MKCGREGGKRRGRGEWDEEKGERREGRKIGREEKEKRGSTFKRRVG